MRWFGGKTEPTQDSYLKAGTALVGGLFNRLAPGLASQRYTQEESTAVSTFLNDFVAWGKQQLPPLFALNDEGEIFCIPELDVNSFKSFATSTALQKLYRSDAYKVKPAEERLTTALHAWIASMDSGVLRDMIPMLKELGWEDEVDQVSQILDYFPAYESNDQFLRLCKSLLVVDKAPPPS